jgi:hypothetical protein
MSAYDHQRELDELQRLLKKAQQEAAANKRRTDDLVNAVYTAAYEAARASGRGLAVKRPPVDKRRKKAEVALIHATDWQLGKKTVTFGIDTLGKRMELFADKVVQITGIQRQDHPVKEAVLMLGGDMVEGVGIYESQVYEIEAYLFEQLFECARIIEQLVRTLAQNFEQVRVVCEFGNHGRIGKYGTMPKGDNVDRMAYRIVQDRTKDIGHVTWQQSDNWYQHFAIGAYKVLLVHGDEIRTYSGTPLFGIIKRVSAWAAGVVPPFDDCYMGHWHNPISATIGNGNRVFITGSPESSNAYAAEHLAAQARPSQRLHFIDPEKGRVTGEYVVWLD